MTVFIGGLLILWGALVIYSVIFRMKQEDYKDTGAIGSSGFIEWELLFKLLNRLPFGVVKSVILLVGISFVTFGSIILS